MLFSVVDAGLVSIGRDAESWTSTLLFEESRGQCLCLDPQDSGVLYFGTRGRGVWKSPHAGQTWHDLELPEPDVFSLAVSSADGAVYAGTEPSRLFKSSDGGAEWTELEGLQEIPSRDEWSFPPRPYTSHVRWIAPNPADANLLLAGIELGGLMLSRDGGATWTDHRPGAQKDVHAVLWHPNDPTRAYQAAGGGAAFSTDRGESWQPADEGRDRHYTWALAVDPDDPDIWFISASPSPRRAHSDGGALAFIYRKRGSKPWEALAGGLPQPLRHLPYAMTFSGRAIIAGLGDGRLWASEDKGDTWTELAVRGVSLAGLKALVAKTPSA